ncbi:MAG TPA: hypothetical protein DD640_10075 [Clostridiales bacterium]|nr:hypothetical protein [Clostridiales bacterium]
MSADMDKLIETVKDDYDLVFFDTPPAGVVTDAAVLAAKLSGTVLVVRYGKADKRQLQHVVSQLKQVKANLLGFIFNGINAQANDDGYYHSEYYDTSNGYRTKL